MMEINSYQTEGLGFALTNAIFTSPKGYLWSRSWTKEQISIRESMKEGIIYKGTRYLDVEQAYQKCKKSNFDYGQKFTLMVELITIKFLTFPWLLLAIEEKGGEEFLLSCTHQPTSKNTYWETGGDNGFILALLTAYQNGKKNV
jgi:hypothetical protein